jgi:UDP-N-acetylmuramoyl-L-alanyl-D-glutamate--2,6-diaminopimelate ligase
VRPEALELDAAGARFRAAGTELATRLRGRFNLENVLGAVAAALLLEVPAEAIATGVESLQGVPGRFEAVDAGQPFPVIVDYAHTPDSLANVLATARELADGRVVVVFGCGGDRDRGKRAQMGRIAGALADVAIVTSDNPRGEDPAAIRAAMMAGARSVPAGERARLLESDRRAQAINDALALARPGDTVLVAGKGHETGQEVNGVTHPFDDRDAVRQGLRLLGFDPAAGAGAGVPA